MAAGTFTTVFDLTDDGFVGWLLFALALGLAAAFAVVFFWPKGLARFGIVLPANLQGRWPAHVALLLLLIAMTFGFKIFDHRKAMESGCKVIEGPVRDFARIDTNIRFVVAGVPFAYSKYEFTDAFHAVDRDGGPVQPSGFVRICYDPKDNAILRLEVRKTPSG